MAVYKTAPKKMNKITELPETKSRETLRRQLSYNAQNKLKKNFKCGIKCPENDFAKNASMQLETADQNER